MGRSRLHLLVLACLLAFLSACHGDPKPDAVFANSGRSLLVRNARLPGGAPIEILIVDGVIEKVGTTVSAAALETTPETIDAAGRFVVPGVIDSHVHLSYLKVADQLAERGIAAAVDLAAPLPLASGPDSLEIVSTGPMITAVGGYPTRSWGQEGYGIEVDSQETTASAIDKLYAGGARLMKFSIGAGPDLSDELLRFAIDHAHGLGMKVAVHALNDAGAKKAAELGADLLAHTPVESLQPSTIELWSERAVVSTLVAFGNAPSTAANLKALGEAGTTVLYGTDLGNTSDIGISCSELGAMRQAGMQDQEILRAMTSGPADFFGLATLGRIEKGKRARLLLVEEDPSIDIRALCRLSLVVGPS